VQSSIPLPPIDPEDPERCSRLALRLGSTASEVGQSIRYHGSATEPVAPGFEQRRRQKLSIFPEQVRGAPNVGILSESLLVQEQPLFAAPAAAVDAVLQVVSGIPRVLPVSTFANVDALLEGLDGLFVPGGQSNVHPTRFRKQADEGRDGHFDELRDEVALQVIPLALAPGIRASSAAADLTKSTDRVQTDLLTQPMATLFGRCSWGAVLAIFGEVGRLLL
jgi:putative glutamine amidotransferase